MFSRHVTLWSNEKTVLKMKIVTFIKKSPVIIILLYLATGVRGRNWGFASDVTDYITTCYSHFFLPNKCERCSDGWIVRNTTGLQKALNEKLYGQHLVVQAVVNHIKAHVKNSSPAKALALSFHGGTGTGKNYVSRIIAQYIFYNGINSKHVHMISATKEFPHPDMVHFYKDQLRHWIESNVTKCKHSLFIFDEMDKMPAGLLDTIKPYLDYYEHLGGIDYRHAIFLFLSNTAGNEIFKFTYQHWNTGEPRINMKLKPIEQIITKAALNTKEQGGLWHSDLIAKHLITAFLPFLPLEKEHVRQCIRDILISRGYYSKKSDISKEIVEEVISELNFFPENMEIFSVTGCKRVSEKVDFVMTS